MKEREDWGAVLFLDIAGSTRLTHDLGNQEAARRMLKLFDRIQQAVTRNQGRVIKSDGDDLLSVFPGRESSAAAARTAIEAQQAAEEAGLSLYAGLCFGRVIYKIVLDRPDISGLVVNIAARLHKMIEGTPGLIFLDAETAEHLPPELRDACGDFGRRTLKGIGEKQVLSLTWRPSLPEDSTVFHSVARPRSSTAASIDSGNLLVLHHGHQTHRLLPQRAPVQLGRAQGGSHWVPVTGDGVSGRHAEILWENGVWVLKDMSRCGTWLRVSGSPQDIPLSGRTAMLMGSGSICLGRPFLEDHSGDVTLQFRIELAD